MGADGAPAPAAGQRAGRPGRASRVTLWTVHSGDRSRPERTARIRRRDRHGRGLRGVLAPPDVPLHRTRAEGFDDLVVQAVARLEPRWEAHLAGVEFGVEEIPPAGDSAADPVPLARLEPGSPAASADAESRPPRIVVYRRPLMARADGDDDLGELVFEVVVEEFARLLGVNPEDIDPGYPAED
jgi:predicted Zn-dependent protease with MMP-like domain